MIKLGNFAFSQTQLHNRVFAEEDDENEDDDIIEFDYEIALFVY